MKLSKRDRFFAVQHLKTTGNDKILYLVSASIIQYLH
jgi:hypothetical protein